MLLGWRVWYEDGSVIEQTTFEEWCAGPEDGIYGKILYFSTGTPREIQQNDWYFVAPHHSGEFIHGHCQDHKLGEALRRYQGAIFKSGKWGPTDYWRALTDSAMGRSWNCGN